MIENPPKPMTNQELRRIITDAALYAKDAQNIVRLRITPITLDVIAKRLGDARERIDDALAEIDQRFGIDRKDPIHTLGVVRDELVEAKQFIKTS